MVAFKCFYMYCQSFCTFYFDIILICVKTIDLKGDCEWQQVFHHGENFRGKSAMFGNSRRKTACELYYVSLSVLGAVSFFY